MRASHTLWVQVPFLRKRHPDIQTATNKTIKNYMCTRDTGMYLYSL